MTNTLRKYPNIYQPKRPDYDDDGNRLWFRTHISKPNTKYDVYNPYNAICQAKLYRWARHEFKNGTPIGELYGYLLYDQPNISKRHLGCTVMQAIAYNPRKLIGVRKDNSKACPGYFFMSPKDLEYGLEWMICIWLRKITFADNVEDMEFELDELANAKGEDLQGLYWDPFLEPFIQDSFQEFNWMKIWEQFDLKKQEIPVAIKPRPLLRSFA